LDKYGKQTPAGPTSTSIYIQRHKEAKLSEVVPAENCPSDSQNSGWKELLILVLQFSLHY